MRLMPSVWNRLGPFAGAIAFVAWSSVALAQEQPGFHFGSYGRVRVATDMHGGGAREGNFVAHGSRLDLPPYLELELRNTQQADKDVQVRMVSTLAIAGDPFHYTGDWQASTALRNLYVDVKGLGYKTLSLWVGARMYRGDDIYLLDFWPLDNLNTVGAGAAIDVGSGTRVQAHVGTNRLLSEQYTFQQRDLPSRARFGSETVVTLDRIRTIGSTKVTHFFHGFTAKQGLKVSGYGEGHFLPTGKYDPDPNHVGPERTLPSDTGFVVGAQATGYGFGERDTHAHAFVRYARGVAAYGDLAVPSALDASKRATHAEELLLAISGNYEWNLTSTMMAAYLRGFDDGGSGEYSPNKYWEGILALRPSVYTSKYTGVAAEMSYQYKVRKVLDDEGRHRVPQAWRLSVMPFVSPMGWGSYKRPLINAVYTATFRNEAAKELYPTEDPRASRRTEHYLGIHAEWWFDSSSYP